MKRKTIPFNEDMTIPLDGNLYYAEVHGYHYPSEYKDHSLTTEFTKIFLYDEDGNEVDRYHRNYVELIQEIIDTPIEVDYEEEGLDRNECWD